MLNFDPQNRVKEISENLYCVSIGSQANCGGIACILATIEQKIDAIEHDLGLDLDVMERESSEACFYGREIPELIQNAVLDGVSVQLSDIRAGKFIVFRLVGALYHPVDSNINMYKIAGKALVKHWCESHA